MLEIDDGRHLWIHRQGTGDPVILCHGGPGLWDMFAEVAATLAEHVTVIRWDQRGCGRSERRGPYSMERTLADLDAIRAHFGYSQVAVLGHSWGAHLALRYALTNPDRVSKLVYVSGTGLGRDWHPAYERNFAARLGRDHARLTELKQRDRTAAEEREFCVLQWSADFADRSRALGYAERMATPWFEFNEAYFNGVITDAEDLEPACRDLTVPTLIVDGMADIRPRWAVDSLCAALPDVRRVVLPAGHVPWLEEPEQFRLALLDFLAPERPSGRMRPL